MRNPPELQHTTARAATHDFQLEWLVSDRLSTGCLQMYITHDMPMAVNASILEHTMQDLCMIIALGQA
jgi:hypothetical protein